MTKFLGTSVEVITPAMASRLLNEQIGNRTIRRTNVARMAKDMKEGRWKLNGESVVLDEDGKMLDGQHRCMACVAADTPFETLVVRGISRSAQPTLDIGAARNLRDITTMTGQSLGANVNVHVLAAGARSFMSYMNFGEQWSFDGQSAPSAPEVMEYLDQYPVLAESCAAVYKLPIIHRHMMPGQACAVHALISTYYDKELADLFMQQLNDGVSPRPNCPITVLRRQFLEGTNRSRRGSRVAVACYIKTFRRWAGEEEPSATLRFALGDEFPLLGNDPRSAIARRRQKLEKLEKERPRRRALAG